MNTQTDERDAYTHHYDFRRKHIHTHTRNRRGAIMEHEL
jgi:hypothetical protein